ncbi:hypothetical protein B0T17DRAFT_508309 [Bombardia bombarda]|uniref:Uncharacterized protein n=1 Tax=Bombardia bombarda TaxID=252184 RepID=A0AA40C525_9PEZI|nr:hypothetical protein B0T17DRAFT_508309 [Bombardia bombarda]
MAQPSPPSFGSNNPFRRKAPSVPAPSPPVQVASPSAFTIGDYPDALSSASSTPPALPSGDQFRSHLQALPQSARPPPTTSFQKPKVVKKVRVQSPPPSSPESAGAPDRRYLPAGRDDDESSDSSDDDDDDDDDDNERRDPFVHTSTISPASGNEGLGQMPQLTLQRPPPNPFQKTLDDLEPGPRETTQKSTGTLPGTKGSLDVDAFRRLLLTGQTGSSGSLQPAAAAAAAAAASAPGLPSAQLGTQLAASVGDGASIADTSSVSRQSIFDAAPLVQDTPRTSHEISEAEAETDKRGVAVTSYPKIPPPPTTSRRKPPPPSSRHGKLIKVELKGQGQNQVPPEGAVRPSSSSSSPGQPGPAIRTPLSSPSAQPNSHPSDVNKPLPPAPVAFHADEDIESIFDREAAGKVPETDTDLDAVSTPTPRPPTPPNASHALSSHIASQMAMPPPQQQQQPPKKPAPPPRRQPHGRSESRISSAIGGGTSSSTPTPPSHSEEPPTAAEPSLRRSSMDSTRSRTSSLRVSIHAPAPPPPRRSTHGHGHVARGSNSFVSPSAVSFSSIMSSGSERSPSEQPPSEFLHLPSPSPGETGSAGAGFLDGSGVQQPPVIVHAMEGAGGGGGGVYGKQPPPPQSSNNKLSPPPPPPARNHSIRSAKRPPSVRSIDATSRRLTTGTGSSGVMSPPLPPPPPPPPRLRGSSRGSMDGPLSTAVRRTSADSVRILGGPVVEEPVGTIAGTGGTGQAEEEVVQDASGAASDILANLDKLQREVDALRGVYEKGDGGGGGGAADGL